MRRKSSFLVLSLVLVAAMAAGLLSTLTAPLPAFAAAIRSVTINRYDAYKNLISSVTRDYSWLEANLPVYGDGNTHYYFQGPAFDSSSLEALWNPAETINIESRDMGRVKGSDLKDLCKLAGGSGPGDTIQLKAADGFSKWFDYENVYNPSARQGRMIITWYNADAGGYPPDYDTGMRLIFFADTGVNPNGWHVFGNWDMHETLPVSRWHFFGGTDPSSSGLSVQNISTINIYQPNLMACDAAGNLKGNFIPGENVYVKGMGMAASASYKLWIQLEPAAVTPLDSLDRPLYGTPYSLTTAGDPSGAQETVSTDTHGDLAPILIWNIPMSAATGKKYDIIADCQSAGTTGQYDSNDYVASSGFQGFTVVASLSLPAAAFTADVFSGIAPLTVHFSDQSTGSPLTWKWDFDNDGNVDSTQQNPSYTYTAAGSYTVKLTVTNADGSDEEVKNSLITVSVIPAAAFSANVTSGTAPLTVHFSDQSTGTPSAWAWDFDNDGTVDSISRNPSYTYTQAGLYSVKLTVSNAAGSDAELKTDYIKVDQPPLTLLWGPYLSGATATEITVNIRTSVSSNATIEYAAESYFNNSGTYNLRATDGISAALHHIPLSALQAGTTYRYRVKYNGVYTADFHFRTFPASGTFSFAVYGDTQDNPPAYYQSQRHKLIADSIAADADILFAVNTGDLVSDGSDTAAWDRYFEAARSMLTGITVFPALGNHENNSPLYFDIFGVQPYYSLDCSAAHFSVLNSTGNISAQTTWLDSDLDSWQPWKFVFFHYPAYTSDPDHFGGWSDLREAWEPLFTSHGIEAVWNGDIHIYERYLENGIMYSVIGTGGGQPYTLGINKYPGYQNGLDHFLGYARVTVDVTAGTTVAQIVRVADISPDGTQITVCPKGTVFETYSLNTPLIINANAGPNGSISPSGAVSVEYGASRTFTITPDNGFAISTLVVDGNLVTPTPTGYTFTNVISNHSIAVTFTRTLQLGLVAGWNIFSTPVSLDPAPNKLSDILAGVNFDIIYGFDAGTQSWVIPPAAYQVRPCEAFYIHLLSPANLTLKVNPNLTAPPRKYLEAGWNLISLANLTALKATYAVLSIETVTGGLTGYTQVLSQGYGSQEPWVYLKGQRLPEIEGPGWLQPFRGYWVFMVNPGALAGFSMTPWP